MEIRCTKSILKICCKGSNENCYPGLGHNPFHCLTLRMSSLIKIAEQGKRRNCWGKPRSPRLFDIYRHITYQAKNQGNDYNYIDLFEYCIPGHSFAITESTVTVAIQQALKRASLKGTNGTNSSKVMFEGNIKNLRTRLTSRDYPNNLVDKILS